MPEILMALAAGVLVLWLVGRFTQGNPANLAQAGRVGQKTVGVLLIVAAGALVLRGGIVAAAPILLLALSLLGRPIGLRNMFDWGRKPTGQKSSVRTRMLVMELDHDSGIMDGEVLEGSFKGRRLSTLSREELVALLSQLRRTSDQSASLLETFLDRTYSGWRSADGTRASSRNATTGAMTRDEAYSVLGLKAGASTTEIRSAHRRLMKQFHPDHGGSDYLAAKINQAKDLLMG